MRNWLQERENWVVRVLRCVSDAVIATDQSELITFMNPVAEDLTGLLFKDVMGKGLKDLLCFKDEKDVAVDNEDSIVKRTDEASVMLSKQALLLNKNKQKVPVYYGSTSVRDNEENVIGKVLVIRDIAAERRVKNGVDKRIKDLRKVVEGTIEAVSLVVETRDSYTAGHQKRVARLACFIAGEMGLSETQENTVLVAGALHDIGKIFLPNEILNKTGELTGNEYSTIMNHPQVGYDILKEIEFPWPIARIVLQHHERMDGSGYPYGLEGDEIMLEAKILGVADVVEAMSYERPHRQALGVDKALTEISKENRLAYDDEAVEACLRLFKEKGYTFEWQ